MERLSSDILEEDFIKTFQVIHFTQYWLGFQRVSIKHKYVTAPSVCYQFYSSALCLSNITSAAYFIFNCESCLEAASSMFFFKLGIIITVVINAMIAWRNTFYNGNTNSQLYVKLQKIDRILKMRGSTKANHIVFLFSVGAIAASVVAWASGIVLLNIVAMKTICPALLFIQVRQVGSYIEMVLVSCILLFLAMRLEHINVILERESKHMKSNQLETIISLLANEQYRDNIQNLDKLASGIYYILDAVADFMKLFQFSVLSFVCQVMVWDFTLMQNVVTAIKEQANTKNFRPADINYVAICAATLSVVMIAISVLSVLANVTTRKINQTRKLYSNVLSSTSLIEDKLQKKSRQILMLLDIKPTFTIYDIFTVDNRLPLHIFAITASYTIVLLQFATI